MEYACDRSQWTPDSAAEACQLCDAPFTFTRAKHHCRRCGLVVCHDCSPKKIEFPNGDDKPHRICAPCFRDTMTRRRFVDEVAHKLQKNLAALHGSTTFLLYAGSGREPPVSVEVWLSEGLDLVCWRRLDRHNHGVDDDGDGDENDDDDDEELLSGDSKTAASSRVEAKPVHTFEGVYEGPVSLEFQQRLQSGCCAGLFGSGGGKPDPDCVFSLMFGGGFSLDLGVADARQRDVWLARFGELACLVEFAKWHAEHGRFKMQTALRAERRRVNGIELQREQAQRREARRDLRRTHTVRLKAKYGKADAL